MNDAFNTVVEEFSPDNLDTILEPPSSQEKFVENIDFTTNLREAMSKLYIGCKDFTVLKFVVRLFNLKITHEWTNQSFTELLQFFQSVLPPGNRTPENTYRADKIIMDLGLKYEKNTFL